VLDPVERYARDARAARGKVGLRRAPAGVLAWTTAGIYKPSPAYTKLAERQAADSARDASVRSLRMAGIAAGARAFGFTTFWINRSGAPVETTMVRRRTGSSARLPSCPPSSARGADRGVRRRMLLPNHGMYWPPLTSITCPVT
jgi:hypothetical protein